MKVSKKDWIKESNVFVDDVKVCGIFFFFVVEDHFYKSIFQVKGYV